MSDLKGDKHILTHLAIFVAIFFCVIVLAQAAAAENETNNSFSYNPQDTNNALQDVSTQSKNVITQVKNIVPYEFWLFATIALAILLLFVRGGNQAYGGLMRLGMYFAIIVAVLWFLLSR